MDAAHIHLVLVHIPIVLTWLALPLLLWGAFSRDIRKLALALLICLGPLLFFSQQSGERAEDRVEKSPGFSKGIVHEHEEAGELALILGWVVSLSAAIVLGLESRRGMPTRAGTAVLVALTSALAFAVLRAGALGGQIMHPEIRGSGPFGVSPETVQSVPPDDD